MIARRAIRRRSSPEDRARIEDAYRLDAGLDTEPTRPSSSRWLQTLRRLDRRASSRTA